MEISDITATDLQDEIIGPKVIEGYRKKVSKGMKNNIYMNSLAVYNSSMFEESENFLGTVVDLIENDFTLVLDEYNSNFISNEITPGIYTFIDLSEVLTRKLQHSFDGFNNSIDIEFNDISMRTKLIVRPDIIALRLDEKKFFSTKQCFNPHWDCKQYHECNSQKIINLSTIEKLHLKCDVVDKSVVNGIREPTLLSSVLRNQ